MRSVAHLYCFYCLLLNAFIFHFHSDEDELLDILNSELNNGRLAMVAFMGMLAQENFTGLPLMSSFIDWIAGNNELIITPSEVHFDIADFITTRWLAAQKLFEGGVPAAIP